MYQKTMMHEMKNPVVAALPDTAIHAPIQLEIEAALKKAYGSPAVPAASDSLVSVGQGMTNPSIAPASPGLN